VGIQKYLLLISYHFGFLHQCQWVTFPPARRLELITYQAEPNGKWEMALRLPFVELDSLEAVLDRMSEGPSPFQARIRISKRHLGHHGPGLQN
jgi:hypothetical protein